MTFATQRRVRFAHCDGAGIVYYPRLFEMIDGAIEDWFRETLGAGRSETHLVRRLGTPIVQITTRFHSASRLDELLTFTVGVAAVGRSSLDLDVAAACDGDLRLEATVRQVPVDLDAMKPVAWPVEWRDLMGAEAA